MCIIIIKQKTQKISKETLRNSARINPHGLGIIWLDNFKVEHMKSKDWLKLHTSRPFIAHFRFATIGVVNRANIHPFQCGANKNEWLMMNGTIHGLGNLHECDTKVLARQLGGKPRHTWKTELRKHTCRFVAVNVRNRTFEIFNKELYTYVNGVWYSKTNVLTDHLVGVYGTLKRGYGNYNRYLRDCKFLGSGKTLHKYPLYAEGLPVLFDRKGSGHQVDIDLFAVDTETLKDLDSLEGHPNWYKRKQILLKVRGQVRKAWVYFMQGDEPKHKKTAKSYSPLGLKAINKWRFEDNPTDIFKGLTCTNIEDEFDISNETPMCPNCHADLVKDEWSLNDDSYYCEDCGTWHSVAEVKQFS